MTCGIAKATKIGSIWLMVASVLLTELSPTRTTAPALLAIEPMRPETGARISVKVSRVWTLAFAASSASSWASADFTAVCALSRCTTVPAFLPSNSSKRWRSRRVWTSCAWFLRIWASIWPSCALSVRASSSNSRSPSLTSAPSSTWTFMIWLSVRGLIWMEAIAWTVPTASTMTGMDFWAILATTTGIGPPGLARPRRPGGCAMAAGLLPWGCSAALAAPNPRRWATSSR